MFRKILFFMLPIVSVCCAQEAQQEKPLDMPSDSSIKGNPPGRYHYNNRMTVFNIYHQSYERIQPEALYVGVDLWITTTFIHTNSCYRKKHNELISIIGMGEFSMGYNFRFLERNHFTLFLGVGVFGDSSKYYYSSCHSKTRFKESRRHSFSLPALVYGTSGFKFDHEFNSIFNLGVNFKALMGGSSPYGWLLQCRKMGKPHYWI